MEDLTKILRLAAARLAIKNLNEAYGKSPEPKVRDAILASIAKAKTKLCKLKGE